MCSALELSCSAVRDGSIVIVNRLLIKTAESSLNRFASAPPPPSYFLYSFSMHMKFIGSGTASS